MNQCVCGEKFEDNEQGRADLAMHIYEEHQGKSYFTGSDGKSKQLKVNWVVPVNKLDKC